MNTSILISSITNPTLLFFILGALAVVVKSNVTIPDAISRFLSLYLLFAIGFKGGVELRHGGITTEVFSTLILAVFLSAFVALYSFFILRKKLSVSNAGAVAACYGSVSAVTFIVGASFLVSENIEFGGHMVACMALMESPAIIIGVILIRKFEQKENGHNRFSHIIHESFTNASVYILLGSLLVGLLTSPQHAEDIKPFTTDIFKGFLVLFMLEMGILAAKGFRAFIKNGWFVSLFAIVMPLLNGLLAFAITGLFDMNEGNRFLLVILSASASHIAVPAAMRIAAPKADPGIYVPMALVITFPFVLVVGIPLFWWMIHYL
ncbi:MAG: sodium-dependent bicarbonate transport family permease [Chitinophagaceae bacterium]|nr:sodium-dependent bicarbonate transport family permease [Chitinophagaceae bacterium]